MADRKKAKTLANRNGTCYNKSMDSQQHRLIKEARDTLVDGFGLFRTVKKSTPPADIAADLGLDELQLRQLSQVAQTLWELMLDDPYPPACLECGQSLPTPAVPRLWGQSLSKGRPRQYCSDACRQAAYRDRKNEDD